MAALVTLGFRAHEARAAAAKAQAEAVSNVPRVKTKREGGPGWQGKRRQFTDEFKAGAVKLVLDEGRSVARGSPSARAQTGRGHAQGQVDLRATRAAAC